jgi:hypothetical protein
MTRQKPFTRGRSAHGEKQRRAGFDPSEGCVILGYGNRRVPKLPRTFIFANANEAFAVQATIKRDCRRLRTNWNCQS